MALFAEFLQKEISLKKLMADSPTLLGVCAGAKLYEPPINGDEAPIILSMDGKAWLTTEYETDAFYQYINDGLAKS